MGSYWETTSNRKKWIMLLLLLVVIGMMLLLWIKTKKKSKSSADLYDHLTTGDECIACCGEHPHCGDVNINHE